MSRPSLPRKCKGVKGPNLSISKRNPTSPSIKKRKKKTANMAEQRPASQSNDPTSAHAASGTADDGVYATRQALGEALLNAARFRLGAMAGVGEDNNVDGVCWSWDILGRNIRFFAEEFFPKKISWELLSTANQQSLTFWAPKARQYLECGAGSCIIFEGWIWRIIVFNIFNTFGDRCRTKYWEGFGRLTDVLDPVPPLTDLDLRRYYNWRSLTVMMLEMATRDKARYDVAYVTELITNEVSCFFQVDPERKAVFDRRLETIAKEAVAADWKMQRTRMEWTIQFTDPDTNLESGFPFKLIEDAFCKQTHANSSAAMVHHGIQLLQAEFLDGRPVDVVTRPLLSMRYYPDYDRFDHEEHVRPMSATVDWYFGEDEETKDSDAEVKKTVFDRPVGEQQGKGEELEE